jgi:O-antigen/teichoic acid export membrane protein
MSPMGSEQRTRNYLRQLQGSLIFKGVAVVTSFLVVPLMIQYLGQEQYGIWSTLLSIMSWVVFFDLGIGNGLRNKVAEALAGDDHAQAAGYISSGYTILGALTLLLLVIIFAVSFAIHWQSIFNFHGIPESTLRNMVLVAFLFVILNFWVGLISQVVNAVQWTSLATAGQCISGLLSLIFVFVLQKITHRSLLFMATAYGSALVCSNIMLSIFFYSKRPELTPRLAFKKHHLHPLLSIGLQFFVIQLAVLIIFTTDKILITQLFGPQAVTPYDVVFKLFSIVTLLHGLIMAPLWSSYTDAYHRGDHLWLRCTLRKQLYVFFAIAMGLLVIALVAKPVLKVWVGSAVPISSALVICMSLYVLVMVWNNVFSIFLNGVQKIRLSLIVAVFMMTANIPLSILFAHFTELGVASVALGTTVALLPAALFGPLQTAKILRHEDRGIWGR